MIIAIYGKLFELSDPRGRERVAGFVVRRGRPAPGQRVTRAGKMPWNRLKFKLKMANAQIGAGLPY
jgi:hypothetical protein